MAFNRLQSDCIVKSDLAFKRPSWCNELAKTDRNYVKHIFADICEKIFSDYVAYLAKTDLNNVKDSFSD